MLAEITDEDRCHIYFIKGVTKEQRSKENILALLGNKKLKMGFCLCPLGGAITLIQEGSK